MTDQHSNDDGLFSNDDASDGNQPDPVSSSSTTGEDGNPLESLVGEGKKFKSVEDLARGKMESDNFIAKMQREQQELREELNKRLTLEEVLAKIEEKKRTPDPEPDHTIDEDSDGSRNSVDLSQVEKLVEEKLKQETSRAAQRRNVESVKSIMKERFGNDYVRVMESKIEELGVGKDWANGLAATEPKAFLSLMGTPAPRGDVTQPPASQVRSTASGSSRLTMSDFDKMRKEDPARYFSKEVQMEIHNRAQEDPESFFS